MGEAARHDRSVNDAWAQLMAANANNRHLCWRDDASDLTDTKITKAGQSDGRVRQLRSLPRASAIDQ
jgi:hypothetical protein